MDEKRHCVEYFDGTLTHGKISVGKNILWSTVGTSKMRRMIFKRIVCSLNVEISRNIMWKSVSHA